MQAIDWRSCQEISNRDENEFLESLAKEQYKKLKRELLCLEIGSYQGATAAILAQFGKVYAIDLWGDIFDCESDYETIGEVNFVPFIKNMKRLKLINRVFPIVSSSLVLESIPPMNFDLIYVDANHYYEGVSLDVRMSERHLSNTGLYVFHDYLEPGDRPHVGVRQAVHELIDTDDFEVYKRFGCCMCLKRNP